MKIPRCKDCKHSKRDWLFGYQFAKCCAHPRTSAEDAVKGKTGFFYCETMREFDCGISGRDFEPKPRPWWAFWRSK